MDEGLLMCAQKSQLHFQADLQKQGYEIALETLRAIDWIPSIIFDAPQYVAAEKNMPPIQWDIIRWRVYNPPEGNKANAKNLGY